MSFVSAIFADENQILQLMNYTFEQLFIPLLVDWGENELPGVLDCNDWKDLKMSFSMEYEHEAKDSFHWSELKVVKVMSMEEYYWFFYFPAPQRPPEAIWGMIIRDWCRNYHYYTLETGFDNQLFLCKPTIGEHVVIKSVPSGCTEEEFRQMVFDVHEKNNPNFINV